MKASNHLWKDRLRDVTPAALASEIEIFENEIALRQQGKIDERVFAETRLRRGAYGQRYDNGQRHDGVASRELAYPNGKPSKGPTYAMGSAGHAADQDSVRRAERHAA